MIKSQEPLSFAESLEYVKNAEGSEELVGFIKKFTNLSHAEADEFRRTLNGLDIAKMKSEQIVKIIDLMPETSEDLNKIFVGMSLEEDETKKILEAVKQFK